MTPARQPFDWFFRSRETGRITIGQFPNPALWVFIGAVVVRRLASPTGTAATVIDAVATVAIVWWSIDEIARGVNPWRRVLGTVVLTMGLYGRLVG